jgi:hypothetical protein
MTDEVLSPGQGPHQEPEQGQPQSSAPPRPWYRRRPLLIGLGVAVILAVTIVTDLPEAQTRGTQISDDSSVIASVNADTSSCVFAAKESFTILRDAKQQSLTSADKADVPALLTDDQNACSFTNNDIYNLSNIEVSGTASGRIMQHMVSTVTTWTTSDAIIAIEAIQTLSRDPSNVKAGKMLVHAEHALATDRALVLSEIHSADVLLHYRLPRVPLPSLTA